MIGFLKLKTQSSLNYLGTTKVLNDQKIGSNNFTFQKPNIYAIEVWWNNSARHSVQSVVVSQLWLKYSQARSIEWSADPNKTTYFILLISNLNNSSLRNDEHKKETSNLTTITETWLYRPRIAEQTTEHIHSWTQEVETCQRTGIQDH